MVNILARIVDSERNFNGSADPMITADRGFIQILGPDFGFCLFGSSDRGSQRPPGKLTFSFLRTVPTIVIAHTFCASPDTRISNRQCLLIQG